MAEIGDECAVAQAHGDVLVGGMVVGASIGGQGE